MEDACRARLETTRLSLVLNAFPEDYDSAVASAPKDEMFSNIFARKIK